MTNLEDVLGTGAPPMLHEMGPYVYRRETRLFDVKFLEAAAEESEIVSSSFGSTTRTTSSRRSRWAVRPIGSRR